MRAIAGAALKARVLSLTLGLISLWSPQALASPNTLHNAVSALESDLRAKIGILSRPDGAPVCSAFCLTTSLVATAAHCLASRTSASTPDDNRLSFKLIQPSTHQTAPWVARPAPHQSRARLIAGGQTISFHPPINAHQDWAILKLDTPICRTGGVRISPNPNIAKLSAGKRALVSATITSSDSGSPDFDLQPCTATELSAEAKQRQDKETDFANTRGLLFHTCESGPLASGTPLLTQGEAGLAVVGMHIGTYVRSRYVVHKSGHRERTTSRPVAHIAVRAQHLRNALKELSAANGSK